MNDDELKKMFEEADGSETDSTKSTVAQDNVVVPSNSSENDESKPDTNSNVAPKASDRPSITLKSIKRKIKAWLIRITSDNSKSDAKSEVPLKDRKYLERFPLSFKSTLLILFVMTLLVLLMAFLFMPQFRVLKFEINGNITLSDEELINESGIEMNSHLFSNISGDPLDIIKQDYGKIEDQMMANNPYIKDIQITVSFPSTIKMNVVERNKVAYVKMPDGYAAIDDEGIVIELVTIVPDESSHAVICGLDVSGATILKKIDIKNETDYQKALIVLGAILTADINGSGSDDYAMFSNIKEIRIIPGGNIFLTVVLPSGSLLQVKLNNVTNINEDMSILRRAIVMDTFEGLPDGSFDMTGDEYIYRKYN